MRPPRIFYVQYTAPAGYPPLEHSAWLLAQHGWQVDFLGAQVRGVEALRMRAHPSIRSRHLPVWPGILNRARYVVWLAWVAAELVRSRPSCLYISDVLATPLASIGHRFGIPVVYHEHDTPPLPATPRARMLARSRRRAIRTASFCVAPNAARGAFIRGAGAVEVFEVWNCPLLDEVGLEREPYERDGPCLLYHGSVVPSRLPRAAIEALALLPGATLRVIGYETAGCPGYLEALRSVAAELGVDGRLEIVGLVEDRQMLMAWCRQSDIGLALMPLEATDANEETMAAASNKAFEYLAAGMPLVISDRPEWRAIFEAAGVARVCRPDDATSIAAAVASYLADGSLRAVGETGRQRTLHEWNYDHQFAPVLARITAQAPAHRDGGRIKKL